VAKFVNTISGPNCYLTDMKRAILPKHNPNKNCLKDMSCPFCGYFESLVIHGVTGRVNGESKVSSFTVVMKDDGFDEPLTEGDTEWDNANSADCPECAYAGTVLNFRENRKI
jgi:hypothetical protein